MRIENQADSTMKRSVPLLILSVLVYGSSHGPAHAYIDPGTGSIILQAVIGGIAAGLVVIKTYWHRLKDLFGRKDGAGDPGNPPG